MANLYGNFGNLYKMHREFDQAEGQYMKALALHEELSSRVGMANDYANLGTLENSVVTWVPPVATGRRRLSFIKKSAYRTGFQ
jgi:hypothetical protein